MFVFPCFCSCSAASAAAAVSTRFKENRGETAERNRRPPRSLRGRDQTAGYSGKHARSARCECAVLGRAGDAGKV